jgi:hypothetical protein
VREVISTFFERLMTAASASRYSCDVEQHMEQHTLPKFYITGFHDSAERPRKNPFVWYFPLDEPPARAWRRERARDISARTDYYTLPNEPPERRLAIESLFASLEDGAAIPLRRLARGEDPEGLGVLSLFIASMLARSPVLIEGFERFASRLLNRPATSYPDRARNKPEVTEALKVILGSAIQDLEPRLRRMTWGVWLTTDDKPFIASDSPVAISLPIEGFSVNDLDHPGFELSMPLSRNAALVIARPNSGPRVAVYDAVPEAVREMNLRTASRAASFLIASSTSFPGVAELAG